jgi:large subunit ribosomal protein L3
MASAFVKDDTADSMTKGKKIIIPVTIIECPTMKIFSVRFYKNGTVANEILNENIDKELKRKVKLPKAKGKKIEDIKTETYDDIRVIVYSQVKKIGLKKVPDLAEIGLNGSVEEKLHFVKENLNKEISILDVFEKTQIVDIHGLTKGQGLSGPVKRFGISLKGHKSEKGVRRPGSLGPWHPARVTFMAPQAGQLGLFTRVVYNSKIVDMGKGNFKDAKNLEDFGASKTKSFQGIKNYGDINSDYIILRGSVQGPAKRQMLLTFPLRKTRKQEKKNFELIELR